jgi:hypothetical protein
MGRFRGTPGRRYRRRHRQNECTRTHGGHTCGYFHNPPALVSELTLRTTLMGQKNQPIGPHKWKHNTVNHQLSTYSSFAENLTWGNKILSAAGLHSELSGSPKRELGCTGRRGWLSGLVIAPPRIQTRLGNASVRKQSWRPRPIRSHLCVARYALRSLVDLQRTGFPSARHDSNSTERDGFWRRPTR